MLVTRLKFRGLSCSNNSFEFFLTSGSPAVALTKHINIDFYYMMDTLYIILKPDRIHNMDHTGVSDIRY